MGNATAQAEYIFDEAEAEAALKGVFDAKALRQLENNLRVIRNNTLSELAGITNAFG
jgi:hypothetical protein